MPGQGVIVGVGKLDYPAEFRAPTSARSPLGCQQGRHHHLHLRPPHHPGCRERLFLKRVHELLLGEHGSTTTCSAASVCRTRRCSGASTQPGRQRRGHAAQADAGGHAHPRAPGARPPHRRPRPAGWKQPRDARPSSTRPPTASPSGTSTASSSPAASAAPGPHEARRPPARAARRVLPHHRRRVHAHPGPAEKRWIQAKVEGVTDRCRRSSATSSTGSTPPRRSRSSSPPSTWARSASVSKAPSRAIPDPRRRCSTMAAAPASTRRCWAWPTAAGSTCWCQHRGQELRPALQGVRGPHRPRLGAGLRRREVPPRPDRHLHQRRRQRDPTLELAANPSHLETVDPIVEGMVRATQDHIDDPGFVLGAAGAHPRRRRLRRPGRGGRDAQLSTSRATGWAAPST
jgi:hypothetical protein